VHNLARKTIFFSTASMAQDGYHATGPEAIQFKSCFNHHSVF